MLIKIIASTIAETRSMLSVFILAILLTACGGSGSGIGPASPQVRLNTNMGNIVIRLDNEKAPLTVENFLNYVDSGHYDGTIFHRVIDGFMIQGGGFTGDFEQKSTLDPVANEADNGLLNKRYSIAMARTNDPQSATAQFFINVEDNNALDYTAPTNTGWGYAVFGSVTAGTSVVDSIAQLATAASGPFSRDVPVQSVVIESVERVN